MDPPSSPLIIPVSRVPVEVWSKIFHLCLPPPDSFAAAPLQLQAPLVLTHICTAWALLVRSLPLMWSSLTVTISPSGPLPPYPLAKTWLELSKSYPLTLVLHEKNQGRRVVVDTFIALYMRHLPRWKDVRIYRKGSSQVFEWVHGQPSGDLSAPILETFALTGGMILHPLGRVPFDFSMVLRTARSLTSLEFSGDETIPDYIPWGQLTQLSQTCTRTITEIFTLSQKCPQLEDLTISVLSFEPMIPTGMFHFGHLHSLHLAADAVDFALLFARASFPSLKSLTLTPRVPFRSHSGCLQLQEFKDFVQRSRVTLETLTLSGILHPGGLRDLARQPHFQALTALIIMDPSNEFFDPSANIVDLEALIWGRRGHFLPRLKLLQLYAPLQGRPSWVLGINKALDRIRFSRQDHPFTQCAALEAELNYCSPSDE